MYIHRGGPDEKPCIIGGGEGRGTNEKLSYQSYEGVDQLAECIKTIKENPTDRRILLSAWNPLNDERNSLVSQLNGLVEEHNAGVAEFNNINAETNELIEELNWLP